MGGRVALDAPGGGPVACYLALPARPGPAVVVLHEWWGLLDVFERVADRLAAEGFVALAPDYYGGRTTLDPAEAKRFRDALEPGAPQRAVEVAMDFARAHPLARPARMGLVGYSLGAARALDAARTLPVDALVSYYGWLPPEDVEGIRCPFLGHYGGRDEGDTLADASPMLAALRARGAPAEGFEYAGAGHSFANEALDAFDAGAARLAWERTVAFLKRALA